MARMVLMAEVSGGRVRGRPRLGWMDGVKVALGNRGMTVEAARQCAKTVKRVKLLNIKTQLSSIWAKGCILMTVCVCFT